MIDRLRHIWWIGLLYECDTEPTELFGGFLGLGWGLWLLLPFVTFLSSHAYDDLALIPENLLGLASLVVGMFVLASLRRGTIGSRQSAAMLSFAFWFGVASLFLHADAANTGGVVYGLVAASQAWVHCRMAEAANAQRHIL